MNWQRAWYAATVTPVLWLLLPLHALFVGVSTLRRWLYRSHWLASHKAPVPLIVVGNINLGGSGKTPVTLAVVEHLRRNGWNPGIISRGYGGSGPFPLQVNPQVAISACGDEPWLLQRRTGVPLVVAPDRVLAAQFLCQHNPQVDIIVADDGLQHYRLQRDLELLVIDGKRGFGNGWRLPIGPLREPIKRATQVDFCLQNGGQQPLSSLPDGLPVALFQLQPQPWRRVIDDSPVASELLSLATDEIIAVAGIAAPQRFFSTITDLGIVPQQCRSYADHYPFSATDFVDIEPQQWLLMTEKDAVKCRDFAQKNWCYLPVIAQFTNEFWAAFDVRLQALKVRHSESA